MALGDIQRVVPGLVEQRRVVRSPVVGTVQRFTAHRGELGRALVPGQHLGRVGFDQVALQHRVGVADAEGRGREDGRGPADDVPLALWNIGIRVEDDVLITAKGNEVLTAAAPKTVTEIEAVMGKT